MFSSLFKGFAGEGGGKKLPLLLLLCGAVGAVLLLLGGEQGWKPGGKTDGGKAQDDPEAVSEAAKEELSNLLSSIEGVGKVKIHLTIASAPPDSKQKLQGIAVLCEGGGDPVIQKRIIGLLSALYGLGSHRIYVGELQEMPQAANFQSAPAYSAAPANIV